jgi:gluconolactonase
MAWLFRRTAAPYVADSARTHDPDAPHHINALTVLDNCRLGASRVLAQIEP